MPSCSAESGFSRPACSGGGRGRWAVVVGGGGGGGKGGAGKRTMGCRGALLSWGSAGPLALAAAVGGGGGGVCVCVAGGVGGGRVAQAGRGRGRASAAAALAHGTPRQACARAHARAPPPHVRAPRAAAPFCSRGRRPGPRLMVWRSSDTSTRRAAAASSTPSDSRCSTSPPSSRTISWVCVLCVCVGGGTRTLASRLARWLGEVVLGG